MKIYESNKTSLKSSSLKVIINKSNVGGCCASANKSARTAQCHLYFRKLKYIKSFYIFVFTLIVYEMLTFQIFYLENENQGHRVQWCHSLEKILTIYQYHFFVFNFHQHMTYENKSNMHTQAHTYITLFTLQANLADFPQNNI